MVDISTSSSKAISISMKFKLALGNQFLLNVIDKYTFKSRVSNYTDKFDEEIKD